MHYYCYCGLTEKSFWEAAECVDRIRERLGLELLDLDLECHFNGCTGTLQPKVVNYLYTSPNILRATSSRDVQTVSSPSRDECSAFGPSASDDVFDVGFSVPHQKTLVTEHEGTRATRLHIARRSVACTIIIQYYAAAATCTSSIFTSSHSIDKRAVWSRCVDGYIRPRMILCIIRGWI
jgi:hypothetical protein